MPASFALSARRRRCKRERDKNQGTVDCPVGALGKSTNQVVEHALRHKAGLAPDDAAGKAALSPAWLAALARYVPEPFRHIG